jgi:hypothetical protein
MHYQRQCLPYLQITNHLEYTMSFLINSYNTSSTTYSIEEYVGEEVYIKIHMEPAMCNLFIIKDNTPIIYPNLEIFLVSQYTGEEIQSKNIQTKKCYMIFPNEDYIIKYNGNVIFKLNKVKGWNIDFA